MIRTLFAVAALSMALAPQAHAWNDLFNSVWGAKGNDTGGIIPWSPDNERAAFEIAQNNCGFWNKYAVATSIHRVPGDYIVYACQWDPPHYRQVRHRHRRVHVKIEK